MANDYTGRIWRITQAGSTPFGTTNFKFEGGVWSGFSAAGKTFIITDAAGRVYTFTSPSNASTMDFFKFGWLSGPLAFSGTFDGEIDLFMATKG